MKKTMFLRGASALTLIFCGAAGAAHAQSRSSNDQGPVLVEEVIVTGSFIRGTPEDASLPVDVIGIEDLQKPLEYVRDAIDKYWSEGQLELSLNVGCASARKP